MEYRWNVYGIFIEYGDTYGICTEDVWNMHGICMEYAWEMNGISRNIG